MDNHGFRYYDSELGRYLTRDPIGYPDGFNNYLYVNNNPINKIDPLGLKEIGYFEGLWGDIKDTGSLIKRKTIEVASNNKVQAVVKGAGGLAEMAIGAAGVVAPEPATTAGGLLLSAHGIDTVEAAVRQWRTGENVETQTHDFVKSTAIDLGASERGASTIAAGVEIFAPMSAEFKIAGAMSTAAGTVDNALMQVDDLKGVTQYDAPAGPEQMFGPYKRIDSNTQSSEVSNLIEESGELWGKARQSSNHAQVQAYYGPLRKGQKGVEFYTPLKPDSSGAYARWTTDEGASWVDEFEEYLKIPVDVTKNTHTE